MSSTQNPHLLLENSYCFTEKPDTFPSNTPLAQLADWRHGKTTPHAHSAPRAHTQDLSPTRFPQPRHASPHSRKS